MTNRNAVVLKSSLALAHREGNSSESRACAKDGPSCSRPSLHMCCRASPGSFKMIKRISLDSDGTSARFGIYLLCQLCLCGACPSCFSLRLRPHRSSLHGAQMLGAVGYAFRGLCVCVSLLRSTTPSPSFIRLSVHRCPS